MSQIKSRGTGLEEKGWIILKKIGFRFIKHPKDVIGHPDAANKTKKTAVFFDSEFWHGYRWEKTKKDIKSNKKFWHRKIEQNIKRDKTVNKSLKRLGWKVIRVREKELSNKNLEKTSRRLMKLTEARK
ncbi:DNA mismatch endonuclease Vsr [Candidatus Peregrinibacteria bacterium]|nr:DNA mismatch endonuclease Vsr [Candidatus Peregrinibacteria bacterium]